MRRFRDPGIEVYIYMAKARANNSKNYENINDLGVLGGGALNQNGNQNQSQINKNTEKRHAKIYAES